MLFWAEPAKVPTMRSIVGRQAEGLLASGQITMRKIDGWHTLAEPADQPIDLAA